MQLALSHGPIDKITRILVDDRRAWSGEATGGPILVEAETLFGDVEGGVSGTVDLDMGADDQLQNAYLVTQLGADIPAFRGVTCAVLNQCYMGNNPYLKPWSFKAQRVYVTSGGAEQWYSEKAGIPQELDGPASFVFLLDRSISLTLDQFNTIKQAVNDGLDLIEEFKLFAPYIRIDILVIFYSAGSEQYGKRDVDSTDITDIRNFIAAAGQITGGLVDDAFFYVKEEFLETIDTDFDTRSVIFVTDTETEDQMVQASSEGGNAYEMIERLAPFDDLDTVDIYAINYKSSTTTWTGLIDNTDIDDIPIISGTDQSGLSEAVARGLASRLFDMNPAHIIRECLTDPVWGMGYSVNDIDSVSFTYAADYLFTERFGISITWSAESPIIDFVNEILRYIDATLYVDRVTGKFVLKLIRDDYALSDLITLDESNVVSISDAKRPTIGEPVASVTVDFWNPIIGETASLTKHNQALFEIQTGGGGGTTVSYSGITSRVLAARVCLRDLVSLSTPLLSCSIEVGRIAEDLNIGDAFILDWPDLGINSLVMRVQQMSLGNIESNTIRIDALEDAFSMPSRTTAAGGQGSIWTDPVYDPVLDASPRIVSELPYYELVTFLGATITDGLLDADPDTGFVFAAGGRQGNEMNADVHTDSGAGYSRVGVMDFCPVAVLAEDITYTATQLHYTSGVDLSAVVIGSVAQINNELVRVDSLSTDSNGTFITVGRGVLDTAPAEHLANASIVFWGSDWVYDTTQYTASDDVDVKILTKRPSNIMLIEDAPIDNVNLSSRAIRPYPPGDLQVDGQSYPTAVEFDYTNVITWAHRDRLQQTGAYIYDYTDGDIGPEAGTTYKIVAQAIMENLDVQDFGEDTTAAATYTFSGTDSNMSAVPVGAEYVKISVYSVHDGYDSWQPASVTIPVVFDSSPASGGKFLIETITLTSAGEFDFDSIPSGYARLIIEGYVHTTDSGPNEWVELFFNSDTNSGNYHTQYYAGSESAVQGTEYTGALLARITDASSQSGAYGFMSITIEGYEDTAIIKGAYGVFGGQYVTTLHMDSGAAFVSHHSMTAAITRVRLKDDTTPTHGLLGTLNLYGEY